jgi:hypothetical protein
MARVTRRGPIATPATLATGRDYREQIKQEKRRKKYEREQAQKKKDGTSCDRISRAKAMEIEALYASPADSPSLVPPTPSTKPTKKKTRLINPSCTDFGPMRHVQFNKPVAKWFLCGQCDAWDQDKNIIANIKQSSRRYKCIAGHRSCIFPTTGLAPKAFKMLQKTLAQPEKKEAVRRLLHFDESTTMDSEEDSDNSDCDIEAATSHLPCEVNPAYTTEQLHTIIKAEQERYQAEQKRSDRLRALSRKHEATILELRKTVLTKNRQIRYLAKKTEPTSTAEPADDSSSETDEPCSPAVKSGRKNPTSENGHFHEKVTIALNKLLSGKKWGRARIGKELAAMIFEYNDHVCLQAIITKSKHWLRKNVFTCYNILREMDRAGGTLGYEGIEIVRSVETKKVKWYKGSLIPSSAEFKRTAKKVEQLAHVLCPFILGLTAAGDKESIDFQPYWKIMGTVFRAYGLIGIGKLQSLLATYALDGAKITKNLGHVCGGFKVADRASRCPFTGELLLENPTEANAQSRNLCFPLKIIMGKETKETIKEFAPVFQFMEDCESEDIEKNPMAKHYGLMPLTCGANCDLSAGWKCLCKGGAAKVSDLPCHCCPLYKTKWALPNPSTEQPDCNWCHEIHSEVPDWKCYHHSMMTEESLVKAQVELNRLTAGLSGNLANIDSHTKMQSDDIQEATPESYRNPSSIHYEPETAEEKLQYGELLTDELVLRDMSPLGSVFVKHNTLRKALVAEAKIRLLLTELDHGSPSEGAMFLLIQAIPCILHLENRIGIKILTMLVIEGLSNAKKGLLYNDITAEGPRIERFFIRIADIVNKQVLGTQDNSTEWECATDDKMKEIGTITMDNVRTRAIMARLELLIEECIVIEEDKDKWLACIPKFRDGMIKLRSKEDFGAQEISAFQKDIDEFFQLWVELWGLEGCTNYIHMMSSGHLSTYLFKWKNLYRHSQQGWEAFNSLLKTFYFRRTGHGGGTNRGRGRRSRLLPIGRWLQRRVIWLCGFEEEFIESFVGENPGAFRSGDLDVGINDGVPAAEEDIFQGGVGEDGFV